MPVNSGSSQVPSSFCVIDEELDAAGDGRMVVQPGGQQAHHGPGGLRGGGRALAAQVRDRRSCRAIRPSRRTACWWARSQLAPATTAGSSVGTPTADQPGQRLPGAVDVVDAPAAEPASVGAFASRRTIGHGPIDGRIAHAAAQAGPGAPSTRPVRSGVLGSIMALWSAKGTWQRNSRSLLRSKAAPAAVAFCMASIQSEPPVDRRRSPGAFARRWSSASACVVIGDAATPAAGRRRASRGTSAELRLQGHQHHRRVVAVGIEVVGVLEAPAARLGVDRLRPIARPADLLVQQPVDRLAHRRIARAARRRPPAPGPRSPCPRRATCRAASRAVPVSSSSITRSSNCSWQYCTSGLSSG